MRLHTSIFLTALCLFMASCEPAPDSPDTSQIDPQELLDSVVRINATQQDWNQWQPWEKEPPRQRRALAAIIAPQRVITTAEIAANATYLEFESADGTRFIPARVIVRDDEVNLALLGPADEAQGEEFFEGTTPLELAEPSELGDTLHILQLEANGVALSTPGILQSVELTDSFLPGHHFLTFLVKASMQSAASSYTLPVIKNDKLAGVLISYSSKDQICDVASTDIIRRFLEAAAVEPYQGFPSLGVRVAMTEDSSFREWLELGDEQGGLFVSSVQENSPAQKAGILKDDVILEVDGYPIDRRGYYESAQYGNLSWVHLVRGEKKVGDTLSIVLLREGELKEVEATLQRKDPNDKLVPEYLFDQQPSYVVKGGLIFQQLTREILERYGKEWQSRAPLNLLDAYDNPHRYEDEMRRVVFLSSVIPTPATIGYERLRNLIVDKVNGVEIRDMKDLSEAFASVDGPMHAIEFMDEHIVVYLDERLSSAVDAQLLQRGLSKLEHIEPEPAHEPGPDSDQSE
ncbi:MAG: PDZ domain-containing protein [Akkermansiaceae bacterium]|nr:PDZ domain-containing protein [Akkermansiaceae bacterium]